MKTNASASLKNLAKELRHCAVKTPKTVDSYSPRHACGYNSALPTDQKWEMIRYGAFEAHKRERGDNRALVATIVKAAHKKYEI